MSVCVWPQRLHKAELETITDREQQWNRLVELNVQEQCINLFANPIVQRSQVTHHTAATWHLVVSGGRQSSSLVLTIGTHSLTFDTL